MCMISEREEWAGTRSGNTRWCVAVGQVQQKKGMNPFEWFIFLVIPNSRGCRHLIDVSLVIHNHLRSGWQRRVIDRDHL